MAPTRTSSRKSALSRKNALSRIVLPQYAMHSSLVLIPGVLYHLTLPRLAAATLLSRYKNSLGSLEIVKSLLSEFELEDVDLSPLSEDAVAGINLFNDREQEAASLRVTSGSTRYESHFDDVILAVLPNQSLITFPEAEEKAHQCSEIVTICRIIGINGDQHGVRVTVKALARALKAPEQAQRPSEIIVSVVWNDYPSVSNAKFSALKKSALVLFRLIDEFLVKYREAVADKAKNKDLLDLDPLASALFLQLAGAKELSKSYLTLQRSFKSANNVNPERSSMELVDHATAILPFPNYEKLKVLSITDANKRFEYFHEIMDKLTIVFNLIQDNNSRMTHWYNEEAANLQKAALVAGHLRSVRSLLDRFSSQSKNNASKLKQLVRRNGSSGGSSNFGSNGNDSDDDDLKVISDFINKRLPEITSISNDSKRLLYKDFKRVKSPSPGNADFHVIRNYLEIIADIPWDVHVSKFKSNKDIDLTEARAQLDKDHYGLEHVKTRLIQYLVVLKLLGANAEKELENEPKTTRKISREMESKKFTRESANGQSIIVPFNEETNDNSVDIDNETSEPFQKKRALKVSRENKSPIIMLAGPPGVGKTSLAKSIATTLGRAFQRVSLGGVKDESEIRGHRRTYVGAMPGTIVQALRKSGSMNPVILLDEIDKIIGGNSNSSKFNGDPAAALLEVLDPEQNTQFVDHYLGFPIDLSQVIFICTANEPYNLSKPLLDRLEMIELGAYDYNEKLVIGNMYLLPRQVTRNGLPDKDLVYLDEDVMKKVILDYTREAGVRNFERKLGTICRFKAVEYSESLADPLKAYRPKVEEYDLSRYLGIPHPSMAKEIIDYPVMSNRYGVVNGLSYNSDGSGSVLVFESIGFNNDKGSTSLNMTGRLGEVLMESAKIGVTFIKDMLSKKCLNINDKDGYIKRLANMEIHMHVPAGAIQKDGPSAGITMALLFLSLVLQKPVPSNIAMTGELTLRGLVLPIGGLKEKLLGAHLTGHITKIIVPRQNRRDIIDEYVHKINDLGLLNGLLEDDSKSEFKNHAPEEYFYEKYGVRIVYAQEFWDVIRHVWGTELLYEVEQARLHL